jgi:hypothetical protein
MRMGPHSRSLCENCPGTHRKKAFHSRMVCVSLELPDHLFYFENLIDCFLFVVLEMESRALGMLGKCATPELYPHHEPYYLWIQFSMCSPPNFGCLQPTVTGSQLCLGNLANLTTQKAAATP